MNLFRLRLKFLDFVAIAAALAVTVVFAVQAVDRNGPASEVVIQADGTDYLYPLDQDRLIAVDGPLGPTHIEIKDQRVRFVDSPCRDQICVRAGWLTSAGDWAACLPNKVFARVEGERESPVDAQTY